MTTPGHLPDVQIDLEPDCSRKSQAQIRLEEDGGPASCITCSSMWRAWCSLEGWRPATLVCSGAPRRWGQETTWSTGWEPWQGLPEVPQTCRAPRRRHHRRSSRREGGSNTSGRGRSS